MVAALRRAAQSSGTMKFQVDIRFLCSEEHMNWKLATQLSGELITEICHIQSDHEPREDDSFHFH